MREITFRRTLFTCLCATAVAVVGTGCGDDRGSTAESTSVAAATTTAAVADAATTKAITDAYTTFFSGQTPAATRAGLIENGSQFQPVLEATASDPRGLTTSVTVAGVKLTGADQADVTYTMLISGNPVFVDQTGQAVKENGQWKVAAATFCALLALQGGAPAICA